MDKNSHIAVFDSGLGGISVLRELHAIMPNENYVYFGDSANAPYGTKTIDEVRGLSSAVAERLVEDGAKALVVACNTATSASISYLREKYPDIPVIGLEPAIKPAALSGEHPTVLVLATELTLREQKYLRLVEEYEDRAKFLSVPAPKLVEFVERGELHGPELDRYISDLLAPYSDEKIDAIVLGCTHFPFVADAIKKAAGDNVKLFNGGIGAAKEVMNSLAKRNMLTDRNGTGNVIFQNSRNDKDILELSKKLFGIN